MANTKLEPDTLTPFMLQPDPSVGPNDTGALQELLTVDDVAALLKVSKSWVYDTRRLKSSRRK
jgi:hypothetical protein